jgi:hypothetical protein
VIANLAIISFVTREGRKQENITGFVLHLHYESCHIPSPNNKLLSFHIQQLPPHTAFQSHAIPT